MTNEYSACAPSDFHSNRCLTPPLDLRHTQKSAEFLVQAMNTVLAWQTSCRQIFTKAALFQSRGNKWRLSQFWYRMQTTFNPSIFNIDVVLPLLQAWQGPSEISCSPEEAVTVMQARPTLSATFAECSPTSRLVTCSHSFSSISRLVSASSGLRPVIPTHARLALHSGPCSDHMSIIPDVPLAYCCLAPSLCLASSFPTLRTYYVYIPCYIHMSCFPPYL